jgi:hypothetical protein
MSGRLHQSGRPDQSCAGNIRQLFDLEQIRGGAQTGVPPYTSVIGIVLGAGME